MKKTLVLLFGMSVVLSTRAETISNIRIVDQFGESYDISSVTAFTSFKVGEQVSDLDTIRSAIAVDVNRMRESGRFSYVDAKMMVGDDGVDLVYTVVSKHRLRRIEIRGSDKMNKRRIRTKSELEIGQFADDSTFERAAGKIKETYRDHWYPDAKVEWSSRTNDELGTVDVVYDINEGSRLAIKKIIFEGNDIIESRDLRKLMQQKQKSWFPPWSWITGAGKYKEEAVDSDVFTIRSFYMNNGFLDVEVSDPVLDDSKPKKARLVFKISEGQRYRIGKVSLVGITEFPEQDVQRGIRLKGGDIASYENIESASEAIRAYYGNRGYIRVRVRPIYDANSETGIVDIRYEVVEGGIGYIEKVNISGNERTSDKVIRRELVIYPGEKYSRIRVQTSEKRLRNLNYFEYVSVSPEQTSESDKYNLNVKVDEKPTGQFTAGVGFSSVDELVGYAELSQGNFSYKSWPPVGDGQKFKVRAQLGSQRNDLDFSFVEPWFFDRKLSLGIDLYHREARYFSDNYDQTTDGFRLSLGKPLSRFTRGMLAYSLEQFDVFDVAESATQAIKDEEGKRIKSGIKYTWTFDSRDRYFNATRGNRTSVTPYFAGGILGGETDIYGMKVRSSQFWPLIGGMVFNVRGEIESVEAYGESTFVPIFDRLFMGGSYTLRGFEYRDVGPKDSTGEPFGGNSSAFVTAELDVPIWSKIHGAVYYDWGFVNVDAWDFNTRDYNDNWGIGLRLHLPGFPLRLDYAWPITFDEQFHDDSGRFNFLIGHTF